MNEPKRYANTTGGLVLSSWGDYVTLADYLALRVECEAKDARIAELETNLKALADDWQSPVSVTGKPAFTRGANAYRKQCAHEIRAAIDAGREP